MSGLGFLRCPLNLIEIEFSAKNGGQIESIFTKTSFDFVSFYRFVAKLCGSVTNQAKPRYHKL